MTQDEQVIEAMRKLGGVATFGQLNETLDFSSWVSKTPEASVRRIVQRTPVFYKLKPGLWGLAVMKDEIADRLKSDSQGENSHEHDHTYYQGLAVEIGNYWKFDTFVPNQDKNKQFMKRQLKEVTTLPEIYDFTYNEILRFARTVDVVWFNKRKLPHAFFEIEHTTDFSNSLLKFVELQDFHAYFYIVASENRKRQYEDVITRTAFESIKHRVNFADYNQLSEMYDTDPNQMLSAVL